MTSLYVVVIAQTLVTVVILANYRIPVLLVQMNSKIVLTVPMEQLKALANLVFVTVQILPTLVTFVRHQIHALLEPTLKWAKSTAFMEVHLLEQQDLAIVIAHRL